MGDDAGSSRMIRNDGQPKSKKAIFLRLMARVTSLVARSVASRMLGYTCELEIRHNHRTFTFPPTHAHYNGSSITHTLCYFLDKLFLVNGVRKRFRPGSGPPGSHEAKGWSEPAVALMVV